MVLRRDLMGTIIEWLIFLAIVGTMFVGLFAQVWEDAQEIAAEEQRKKDFREVNYWKQKSQHPITHVKVMDGEEFILRR
jgi:hypothetical protein